MITAGWVFILLSFLIARAGIKGRDITDIPGDLGDMFTAAVTGDTAELTEILKRDGPGQTAVIGVTAAGKPPTANPAGVPDKAGEAKLTATTAKVRRALLAEFPGTTIYGYRAGAAAQDHATGTALDIMVGTNKAKGDKVVAWILATTPDTGPPEYPVKYIIWQQRIWSDARRKEGWRKMADRGSVTQNHGDHVHLSMKK